MTRNSDLNCEDLFGCTHNPQIPIVDDYGNIVEWRCHCGGKTAPVVKPAAEPVQVATNPTATLAPGQSDFASVRLPESPKMNSEGETMLRDANEALAQFERSPQPLIRCCFAYESGIAVGDQNDNIFTLRDASRLTVLWNNVPIPVRKGRACIQLNDAAQGLHYWIRSVTQGNIIVFEGLATIVFLPVYKDGTITAEVHRIRRAKAGAFQLDHIRQWLLDRYLSEFENYDESTFVDWIVASMHLPADAGADALETWYRERAQHINQQGRD